jgi:cysteine-rich repeat protein
VAEAGALALTELGDREAAERYLDKALGLDGDHLGALRTLADLSTRPRARGRARSTTPARRGRGPAARRSHRAVVAGRRDLRAAPRGSGRALGLLERVLKLDPDHVGAGEKVADRLVAAERWDDALPVLEMLARRSEGGDRLERARRQSQLGAAYEHLHRTEKAAKHYRLAVEADPDNLDAALGLAGTLTTEAKAVEGTATEGAEERWKEVDKRYREILARFRTGLADGQVADIWYRLGLAARALGDDKKAENALRRALEKEPAHEATLAGPGRAGRTARRLEDGRRGQAWPDRARARRAQGQAARRDRRSGSAASSRTPAAAIGAYLEAQRLAPGGHALLHKLLDAYGEQKQWRRGVEVLDQLAALETAPARRAKYHYAAAVIARDELADTEVAVERFNLALDDAPTTPKAFEAIDKLLSDAHDWKNLARAVRRHLKRLGDDAAPERALELWTRLGDLYLDHLGNPELAIEAFEIAAQLDPDNHGRHEQLADLYLEAGEARRGDAIAELQQLLTFAPDRVEVYKALSNLYKDENELDKAWCLAQALVFLGAGQPEEKALYQKYRPAQFIPATRRLTEELWGKAIIHPAEDRAVGAIFASTLGALAGSTAQPPTAFGLDVGARVDLEHDNRLPARVDQVRRRRAGARRAADAVVRRRRRPAGRQHRRQGQAGAVAPVRQGRAHRRARAGLRDRQAPGLPAARALRDLRAGQRAEDRERVRGGAPGRRRPGAGRRHRRRQEAGGTVKKTVPGPLLEQVAVLAGKLGPRLGNGLVTHWRSATDLTANRVGLILANDLETAAKPGRHRDLDHVEPAGQGAPARAPGVRGVGGVLHRPPPPRADRAGRGLGVSRAAVGIGVGAAALARGRVVGACSDDGHTVVCGDGKAEPPEQCDDGNTDELDGCRMCVAYIPPRNVVKWDFNANAAPGFSSDGCIDVNASTVRVELTGPMAATRDASCSLRQVSFEALPAGTYTAAVTPLDSAGAALVGTPATAALEANQVPSTTVETVVNVTPDKWARPMTGTFYFVLRWAGMSCTTAAPPVTTQVVTLTIGGTPVTASTSAATGLPSRIGSTAPSRWPA